MEYLHTMVRISDLDEALHFYCDLLGMQEVSRRDSERGRFTLVFLCASGDRESAEKHNAPMLELTYNWDPETYTGGPNFGHLAYRVDNIYDTCQFLSDNGVTINRPQGTAAWPLSAPRMASRLSCFRKATPCPNRSPGPPWRTQVPGRSRLREFMQGFVGQPLDAPSPWRQSDPAAPARCRPPPPHWAGQDRPSRPRCRCPGRHQPGLGAQQAPVGTSQASKGAQQRLHRGYSATGRRRKELKAPIAFLKAHQSSDAVATPGNNGTAAVTP